MIHKIMDYCFLGDQRRERDLRRDERRQRERRRDRDQMDLDLDLTDQDQTIDYMGLSVPLISEPPITAQKIVMTSAPLTLKPLKPLKSDRSYDEPALYLEPICHGDHRDCGDDGGHDYHSPVDGGDARRCQCTVCYTTFGYEPAVKVKCLYCETALCNQCYLKVIGRTDIQGPRGTAPWLRADHDSTENTANIASTENTAKDIAITSIATNTLSQTLS